MRFRQPFFYEAGVSLHKVEDILRRLFWTIVWILVAVKLLDELIKHWQAFQASWMVLVPAVLLIAAAIWKLVDREYRVRIVSRDDIIKSRDARIQLLEDKLKHQDFSPNSDTDQLQAISLPEYSDNALISRVGFILEQVENQCQLADNSSSISKSQFSVFWELQGLELYSFRQELAARIQALGKPVPSLIPKSDYTNPDLDARRVREIVQEVVALVDNLSA